jgi:hypothetical protein
MSASPTQPDRLFLTDAFVPRLTAGPYTLTAKQALMLETEPGKHVEVNLSDSKKFSVAAPRFSLDPDEIYSVYPPDGSSGAYESTVPHIVFRRKTLPWERKLLPSTPGEPPPPWMALLLFDEDELKGHSFETRLLSDLVGFQLEDWEKNPPADPNGNRNNRCTTLDIPRKLFQAVTPHEDELRYLAHTRGVFKDHKEDVPGIGDGWFSVILANRLPTPKVDLQPEVQPKRNVAVLISLEGLSDLIKPNPAPKADQEMVRLVVLKSWSFASTGPTFGKRVEALHSTNNGTEKKDLWLRAPLPSAKGPVHTALKFGYAPLPHNLRQGSRTVSWYRGPLVPVPDAARTVNEIYVNADDALQYDKETGLFDVSYAAAWQLGRLLALQAPEFASALLLMERGYVADNLMAEAENQFRGLFNKDPDLKRARRMLQDDLMVAIALEFSE